MRVGFKIRAMTFIEVDYSPSDGIIVNVVLHYLDVNFQGRVDFLIYAIAEVVLRGLDLHF